MAKVYQNVDMSVLPEEYLPDDYSGPTAGPEEHIVGKIKGPGGHRTFKQCHFNIDSTSLTLHQH